MTPQAIHEFHEVVWGHYQLHARELPWRREPFKPYHILLSEIMLQQTQVNRVVEKYQQFLEQFPTMQELAEAPLGDVLIAWSGLGYNRRAKYLHDAAEQLPSDDKTWTLADLEACKGIGHNTAAAVLTYAYNQPIAFIETNVSTVLIHFFFQNEENVSDHTLMPIMDTVLDREHPREFMWAMMDYGSYLKSTVGNISQQSRHYAKQSRFEGSARQIRGEVLRQLTTGAKSEPDLQAQIGDERLVSILSKLESDGLISRQGNKFVLGK